MRSIITTICFIALTANIACADGGLAKYEPESGAYLGIVLDWPDIATMPERFPGNSSADKFANAIIDFNGKTRKHALAGQFIFFPHGAPFESAEVKGKYPTWDKDPSGWATAKEFCEAADRAGAAVVLTLEPWARFRDFYTDWKQGNPAYDATKVFASECAKYGKPVFIRFAHEMNGSWYPWGTWIDANKDLKRGASEETGVTAQDYVTAFRNVYDMFKKNAPNAAMVWCPNQGWLGNDIRDNYTPFYPGDEYTDWVGIDFYERGWNLPGVSGKLWGGLFAFGLTHDSLDDPATKENESVNFYDTYCVKKGKPLMVCETAAMHTYRDDITDADKREISHNLKAGWWNADEYGWIMGVYGTTCYGEKKHKFSINTEFPKLKAIMWFSMGKDEDVVAEKKLKDGGVEHVWFNGAFCDYRIGYNATSVKNKYAPQSESPEEIELYKGLVNNRYFLSEVQGGPEK